MSNTYIVIPLTPREIDVYEAAVTVSDRRDIGLILKMKENTVRYHLANIYKKVGAKGHCDLLLKHYYYGFRPQCSGPRKFPRWSE